MNRRRFVIQTGALLLTPTLLPLRGIAESKPGFESARSYGEEMPDMLISYLAKKLNDLALTWDQKRALLKTAADLEARNAFVREKVVQMLRGFPAKNPLEPVVVKTMQRDGYRVENVMFQSRPDFWVTGNLYVPTSGSGPFPAIVSPCGHYPLARMLPQYQSVYLTLVKSGFVVLAYDPIGQGERRQYLESENKRQRNAVADVRALDARAIAIAAGREPDGVSRMGRDESDRLPVDHAGGGPQTDWVRRSLRRGINDQIHQRGR